VSGEKQNQCQDQIAESEEKIGGILPVGESIGIGLEKVGHCTEQHVDAKGNTGQHPWHGSNQNQERRCSSSQDIVDAAA
jgi:hypothetical protein